MLLAAATGRMEMPFSRWGGWWEEESGAGFPLDTQMEKPKGRLDIPVWSSMERASWGYKFGR